MKEATRLKSIGICFKTDATGDITPLSDRDLFEGIDVEKET